MLVWRGWGRVDEIRHQCCSLGVLGVVVVVKAVGLKPLGPLGLEINPMFYSRNETGDHQIVLIALVAGSVKNRGPHHCLVAARALSQLHRGSLNDGMSLRFRRPRRRDCLYSSTHFFVEYQRLPRMVACNRPR